MLLVDLVPDDLELELLEDLALPEDRVLRELRAVPDDLVLLVEGLFTLVLEFDLVEDEFLTVLVGLVTRVLDLDVPFERTLVPLVFRLVLVAALDSLLVE